MGKVINKNIIGNITETLEFEDFNDFLEWKRLLNEDCDTTVRPENSDVVEVDGITYRKAGEVNGYQDWEEGDSLYCITADDGVSMVSGKVYRIAQKDKKDHSLPVKVSTDTRDVWVDVDVDELIKVVPFGISIGE